MSNAIINSTHQDPVRFASLLRAMLRRGHPLTHIESEFLRRYEWSLVLMERAMKPGSVKNRVRRAHTPRREVRRASAERRRRQRAERDAASRAWLADYRTTRPAGPAPPSELEQVKTPF